MSIEFYKVLHLFGIFCLMLSLGGICLHVINGGTREYASRKFIAMLHGISLLIILIAGMGLLAKEGLMAGGIPGWAIGKLVIWLVLGGLPALIYRKRDLGKVLFFTVWILGGVAAYLAIFKPGA